jgi:DNA-binding transcriptional LysR family regulator
MNLDKLRYFLEAARLEHFGRAAQSLHVTPSAVSHAVASLESELAVRLFEKRGRQIGLTREGGLLKERATLILQEIHGLRASLSNAGASEPVRYRFAATYGLCEHLFTPTWCELWRDRPRTFAEVFALRSSDVLASVLSGEADAGLCVSALPHPELRLDEILTGSLRLFVRKGHPVLARRGADRFRALSELACVMPKAFSGIDVCEVHPVLAEHGLIAHPAMHYDSPDTALAMVAGTDLWTLLPDYVLAWPALSAVAIPASASWKAPYAVSLVTMRRKPRLPLMDELQQRLRKRVGQSG